MTIATQVTNVTQLYPAPSRSTVMFAPVLSPVAVAANTTAEQLFTVPGLIAGTAINVNKPTAQAGLGIVGFRAAANNSLGITFSNNTSAAITPTAAETYIVSDNLSPVPSAGN